MQKGTISYANDKDAHVISIGFAGYTDAVDKLYFDQKLSYSKTAKILSVTSYAIEYHIKNVLGKKARSKGGPNNVRNKDRGDENEQ